MERTKLCRGRGAGGEETPVFGRQVNDDEAVDAAGLGHGGGRFVAEAEDRGPVAADEEDGLAFSLVRRASWTNAEALAEGDVLVGLPLRFCVLDRGAVGEGSVKGMPTSMTSAPLASRARKIGTCSCSAYCRAAVT